MNKPLRILNIRSKTIFLALACCWSAIAFSQTNISGIVNTYHRVIEIIPAKACLRVADPTGLNVNNLVMITQAKGAQINTTNTSSFGNVDNYNGAGNYEIGTICYLIGDSVFLFQDLMNTYDVNSKVQLVQFAEYLSANVIDTVKAQSWDSAAGTGGVIAIYCDLDLTLNAPIYADSSGYAGGAFYNNVGTCGFATPVGIDWYYPITSTSENNGGYKGESIANISASQNSAKGSPANGGGGGNNHNNSGGGGSNLTAGGNGGGNNSGFAYTGCNTGNNFGRGGKALLSSGGLKIYMGGGGGAGHNNNGNPNLNYGGNGGGIVFIWTNNLVGNNRTISARGGNGGASTADGAGGGGAGGTIIMHVTNYMGSTTINANGGNGGLSDDGSLSNRCFGGGGGGSGGAIYFTGSFPAITYSASGGAGGAEINNLGCTGIASVPGAAGTNIENYTFSRSMDPAGYCLFLLPSKLISFDAKLQGQRVLLNWRIDHPEFVEKFIVEKKLGSADYNMIGVVNASDLQYDYSFTDDQVARGNNLYRLRVIEKNHDHYYSSIERIWMATEAGDLTVYPNPSRGQSFLRGKLTPGETILLYDAFGRILYTQVLTNNSEEIALPALGPGVYMIKHHGITRKLIVQ